MSGNDNFDADNASEITVEIITHLSETGLGAEEYQLHQFVDPDALAQLLDSLEEPYRVSFAVKNRDVTITEMGISVQRNQSLN